MTRVIMQGMVDMWLWVAMIKDGCWLAFAAACVMELTALVSCAEGWHITHQRGASR
jgi:hypothetical protein